MAFIGNTPTTQAFTPAVDYFSGNGSTTAFTLSRPVASVAQVQVTIDNVAQNPSSAFTVSSNTITFTSAPLSGTNNIYVYYTSPITQVIAPGQGTVNTTALAGGTVTTTADATLNGLTVGKGGGSTSTNTAVGVSALNATNTIGNCTALGYQALILTTGKQNTAVGSGAGASMTSGEGLAAFGWNAANLNTADNVTALGHNTLGSNTTGANNTAVGNAALNVNTTGASNVAVGRQALVANTTSSNNVALGYQSMYSYQTGGDNVAVGAQAGYSINGNGNSVFVGRSAGYTATGGNNVYVGYQAGYSTTTGAGNTFIGYFAGTANTTGSSNTFVGPSVPGVGAAGYSMTTGSKNTIIGGYNGNQGGLDIRTSSNHIVLSDGDGNPRLIFNNASPPDALIGCTSNSGVQTATAGGFVCDGSNHLWVTRSGAGGATVDIGRTGGAGTGNYLEWWYNGSNTGTVSTNGSTTTYGTSSDYRLKENVAPMTGGLAKVAQLKPCTYKWKVDGSNGQGFIAHELQAVVPDCVTGEKDAVETYLDDDGNEQTRIKPQGIDTSFLVATLTAAIQELKAINDTQAETINALTARIEALENR